MTRAPRAAPVTITWQRDAAFVGFSRDLVAVRWTGVPTHEQIVALSEAHRAAHALGGDVLLLNDVFCLVGGTRVERRSHDRIVELVERCRDHTRAVAHVVEIPGPAGVVTRAFLGAIERLAGNGRTQTASFERPDAAAAWLSTIAGDDVGSRWRAMQSAATLSLAA